MSSGIDKGWIKDKNLDSVAYREGVLNFLTFVYENVPGNRHSCPCKRCRNGSGQIDVEDIFLHLMKYGMDEGYTFWCFHGETSSVNLVDQPRLEAISVSGPINEASRKDSRGRVRCVGLRISRTAMSNSSFARETLVEVNSKRKRDSCEEKLDKLLEDVKGMGDLLKQFIDGFRAGEFVAPCARKITRTNETPLRAPSTSLSTLSQVRDEMISCKILSFTREIVGYGRKYNIGAVTKVHDHDLTLGEVKVVVDKILVPNNPLLGGQQGYATTLEEIGRGGIMYWLDALLPLTDD